MKSIQAGQSFQGCRNGLRYQVCGAGIPAESVRRKKMFGEYMVYVNDKPVLLVCDNTVFVKQLDGLAEFMADADRGYPYPGAKEHFWRLKIGNWPGR